MTEATAPKNEAKKNAVPEAEAESCCSVTEAASCCEPEAKSSCCGPKAKSNVPPTSCGCR